jgi:hypothetical protein
VAVMSSALTARTCVRRVGRFMPNGVQTRYRCDGQRPIPRTRSDGQRFPPPRAPPTTHDPDDSWAPPDRIPAAPMVVVGRSPASNGAARGPQTGRYTF